MAPPKKGQKMSLGSFLTDETLGSSSWADEMEDLPAIPAEPRSSGYGSQRREYAPSSGGGATDRYAGYSRNTDEGFVGRAQLPVPDKPPYTAHIGNLSFDATEMEIEDFFTGCEVSNVRLVRDRLEDRPKGFGYVEFSTKDGLLKALDMNGAQLAGRNVRISVAEPPKEREDSRFQGEWRRGGPLPDLPSNNRRGSGYERSDSHRSDRGDREEGGRRHMDREGESRVRDMGSWERKGPLSPLPPTSPTSERGGHGDREFRRRSPAPDAEGRRGGFRERPPAERQPSAAETDNQWRRSAQPPQRSTPTSPTVPHTRPKLELKKRTEAPVDTVTTPALTSGEKPNPFGAARPIDTLKREKEVEERRAALAAERKAAEEKAREEKRLAAEKKAAEATEAAEAADEKPVESGTPTTEKVEVLRRGSGPPSEAPASVGSPSGEESKEGSTSGRAPKETREPKEPKSERPRVPDNWRSRTGPPPREQRNQRQGQQQGQQEEQQPTEDADGWSTVKPGKKGRGGRPVPA